MHASMMRGLVDLRLEVCLLKCHVHSPDKLDMQRCNFVNESQLLNAALSKWVICPECICGTDTARWTLT